MRKDEAESVQNQSETRDKICTSTYIARYADLLYVKVGLALIWRRVESCYVIEFFGLVKLLNLDINSSRRIDFAVMYKT